MKTSLLKLSSRVALGLCLISIKLWAQTPITGIVNGEGDSAIPYATVEVLNTNRAAVADENGRFEIELPEGNYQLSVQAVGFAKKIQVLQVPARNGNETLSIEIVLKERSTTLDEVVVTAQRSEQELITVPVSVTALSAAKVKNAQVWSLDNLKSMVPNYFAGDNGVSFQQIQGIRGIQVFSENPAIATYIDGVNNLDIIANGFLLTDIERIEVLRGPQGTLFGRNAMGGVVNIITKQPTNKRSTFAEFSVGNLGLQRYGMGIKAPLIENKLFFGFTGQYQYRNGYLEADTTGIPASSFETPGTRIGGQQSIYGNLHLKWLVNDQLDIALNAKGQVDQSDASGFFVTQQLDEALDDPGRVRMSHVGEHRRDILNTSLAINYAAGSFNLSAVTTYQEIGLAYQDTNWPYFGGGVLYSSFRDGKFGVRGEPQQVFTQEFKITSTDGSSPIQYTAGLFGFVQDAFEPTTNIATLFLTGPFEGLTSVGTNQGINNGFAAFGQLSYRFNDHWEITAGLRYDYEERENEFNDFGLTFIDGVEIAAGQDTTVNGSYNALSPKFVLAYQVNKTSNLYASYNRGFRAGGINTQLTQGIDLTFDPEFSDNYEIGFKSASWGNRLRLNLAAYHIRWSDIQFFSEVGPGIFARDNIGDAQTTGVEMELSTIPIQNLNIDVAYGLNFNSEYQNFALRGSPSSEPVDLDGKTLASTPGSTLFIASQYTLPINDITRLIARLEYRGIGDHFSDVENNLQVDGYQTINARIGISYHQTDLFFWMNNVSDERFITFGSPSTINASAPSDFRAIMSAPRTYGLTLTTRF